MPTQVEIQNTILSAQLKMANLVEANRLLLVAGVPVNNIDWTEPKWYYLNTNALQRQFDLQDFTSSSTLAVYDCLNERIGFDTTANSIDTNYQPPTGIIIDTNPQAYIQPEDPITWADFDDGSENPNGNRSILIRPQWIGVNPILSLTSPAETALRLGVDYSLLPFGGIQIIVDLSGAGTPGIADGQTLRSTSYQRA